MPPKKKKEAGPSAHFRIAIGTFNLLNGDKYTGEYQANVKTKVITRHGKFIGLLFPHHDFHK